MSNPEQFRKEINEEPSDLHIAVLISNKGTGSNLKAILDNKAAGLHPHLDVGLVISDKEDSLGIRHAVEADIPHFVHSLIKPKDASKQDVDVLRNEYSRNLAHLLNVNGVDVGVMAGFMTILNPPFFDAFKGVLINIHPGYIPNNPENPGRYEDGTIIPWNQGMMTDKAVANFIGKPEAFSTIHVATAEADFGPVLARVSTPVLVGETVDDIYARLKQQEHQGMRDVLNGHLLRVYVREKHRRAH